jgi:hypothetical protein
MKETVQMSVYQNRRTALHAELVAEGWGESDAAAAIRGWEFEANRRGIDQQTEAFWRAGEAWLADQRRATSVHDADDGSGDG